VTIGSRSRVLGLGLALGASLFSAGPTLAQELNCANEFRSGKLYFSQSLWDKAVERFALSVKGCPDKAEYRARYAMAVAQYAGIQIETVELTGDLEGNRAVVDSVLGMYRLAGSEFDAALAAEDTKKNKKFVSENRYYFWVARYNQGLKLMKEEKHAAADLDFQLSRLVDPSDTKAYSQGAIALITLDRKGDAAALVQEGLARAPEDSTLNGLLETLYLDTALELTRASEETKDPAKATEAESYYNQVLERRGGADANVLFDRGVSRLAKGSALASAAGGESIPADAAEAFRAAAADFHQAGEIIPLAEDPEFYKSALYNEAQATLSAGDLDPAVGVFKQYLALDCRDKAIWQLLAQALVQKGDVKSATSALMVSKSLANQEVAVADAVKNAQGDAAAQGELGDPESVYSYQESGSGNQITTWFWCQKRKAMSFILGSKQGEMTW
jgi:predicted Zn-dependent protease